MSFSSQSNVVCVDFLQTQFMSLKIPVVQMLPQRESLIHGSDALAAPVL